MLLLLLFASRANWLQFEKQGSRYLHSVSFTNLTCDCLVPAWYPHYQLVSLTVSELATISCTVVAVPLGPGAWPHPRTLLLGSWALCLTFQRSCRWCWAQCSKRQWCRMSRTRLRSELCAVVALQTASLSWALTLSETTPSLPTSLTHSSWCGTQVPYRLRDQWTACGLNSHFR